MKVKRVLKWALAVCVIVYIMYSPNSAAETLRVALHTAYQGVMKLADSAAASFDALLRH